jgi:hypothetical protein
MAMIKGEFDIEIQKYNTLAASAEDAARAIRDKTDVHLERARQEESRAEHYRKIVRALKAQNNG